MEYFQISGITCEALVTEGLERISIKEIQQTLRYVSDIKESRKGVIRFTYSGDFSDIVSLKTVFSVYVVTFFSLPRPKAFLGHNVLQNLTSFISHIISNPYFSSKQSLNIEAAGKDSLVIRRLASEIAHELGVNIAVDKGDIEIRLQRDSQKTGWEVLVRLTSRPLVSRSWRKHDMQGALNAATAHAMNLLAGIHDDDRYLNICCGSATLLIERARHADAMTLKGYDLNTNALKIAHENILAAGVENAVEVSIGDCRFLPESDEFYSIITADLPFGLLIGKKQENATLYYELLLEAARLGATDCRFVFLTHDRQNFMNAFEETMMFTLLQSITINLRGIPATIYIFSKKSA